MNSLSWNDYAETYNALLYLKPYQALQQDILQRISQLNPSNMLDAACGTGTLIDRVLTSHRNMSIYGIDYSEQMLEIANVLLKGRVDSLSEVNLNEPLPYEDNFFSLITSVNTLYALENPEKSLREMKRVLKPGGSLILSTPRKGFEDGFILKQHCLSNKPDAYWANVHSSPEREWELLLEAVCDEVIAHKLFQIAKHARAIHSSQEYHFFDKDELVCLLEKIGMTIIENTVSYAGQAILITGQKGELS